MKRIYYEWDVETVVIEEGEECVENHSHSDEIPAEPLSENEVLVLVRDEERGLRSWAYVRNGKMDEMFRDAFEKPVCNVPKRFLSEFLKSIHAK